jgi:hypothetical protein
VRRASFRFDAQVRAACPIYLGIAYAVAGLLLSWLLLRETRVYTQLERPSNATASLSTPPTLRAIFAYTTWGDRTLFAACQAGLVNNLNDGMSWGILPIFFAAQAHAGVDPPNS